MIHILVNGNDKMRLCDKMRLLRIAQSARLRSNAAIGAEI
jgi:hypothetical protein